MGFQWDPAKDAANRAKHLVDFRQSAQVFRGFVLVREDDRRDYGERRLIALGEYEGRLLRIVYTPRGGDIRIISAWKASRDEREIYARARGDRPV